MVALVGPFTPSLPGSELRELRGELAGRAPPFDLAAVRGGARRWCARRSARASCERARRLRGRARLLRRRERARWAASASTLDLEPLMRRAGVDAETALFGEGPGGVVVSGPREALMALSRRRPRRRLSGARHGRRRRRFGIAAGAARIDMSVEEARGLFEAFRSSSRDRPSRTGSREPAAHSSPRFRRALARSSSRTDRDGPARRVRRLRRLRARARRRPARLLRALRAPAPRPGVGRDRDLRERPHHHPARPRPGLPGLRRAQPAGAHRARPRSATCATRPPAAAAGRTPSRSTATTAARSRSPTTAT